MVGRDFVVVVLSKLLVSEHVVCAGDLVRRPIVRGVRSIEGDNTSCAFPDPPN